MGTLAVEQEPKEPLSSSSPEVLKTWLTKTMANVVLVTFSSRVAQLASRVPSNNTVMMGAVIA